MAVQAALEAQEDRRIRCPADGGAADRLAAELEVAKRQLGVQVPVDEIVFIPALPVRVEEVTAAVGGAASGPVMSVTDNQIAIDSSLPLDAAPLVKPGMEVAIDEPALGIKARGVVDDGGEYARHPRRRWIPHLLRGPRRRDAGAAWRLLAAPHDPDQIHQGPRSPPSR